MTDTPATGPVQSNPSPTNSAPPAGPSAATEPPAASATPDPRRRTRTSALWVGVIVFAAVLALLLIFILQNTQAVEISYFTVSGSVSLAVAMLLSTVAGVLLTAIAGSLRIRQLRRRMPRATRH
ncbi:MULTISPECIES: LapA family protein [Prauserella salsuginis group]|uniref:Lipopolysaccharide assembly protein LapA domain-containing protein n=2 Tax=Prauserella salsuginis group TaxID=2893672 RepID=A0ABW6G9F6_9PSEU|nr:MULTISPECIES: lipopolysaccharide assembly protein LapA domain-containing protein [Prauserella salsuginis group]MBB3664104.1 putative integral membrane protein [Prauserella sediminis]MCR3721558.1 putative integral membrane protein [Prauserella flava]MCR3734250.1 putative integral membrane protein [Prauserella salsuginis]